MSRRLFLKAGALLAAITVIISCRERPAPGTGTLTGKIAITETYGMVYQPEKMPIYLLKDVERLDKEHELLGMRIKEELGRRSAIDVKSERLGVKKYVDLANSLFARYAVKDSRTGSGGRFKITGIAPGTYRLLFSYTTPGSNLYSSLQAKKHYHWFFDVEIKAGETLNIDLNKYNARGKPYWDII